MSSKEAVACIIFNPDKTGVCLIKRRDVPVWVLPGGGVDRGEKPEIAALRETEEELLVKPTLKRLIGIYIPKNKLSKKTYLYELTLNAPLRNQRTEETLGALFFDLQKLPPMPPPYRDWIFDALKIPEGAITYSYVPGVHYGNFIKLLILHPIKVFRFLLSRLGCHWNS